MKQTNLTISPVVSVIVPVYNAEKTLRRCVDSVLAQRGVEFEIILVDDASTDKSAEICREYETLYPGKVIFHQNSKNGGASVTRNAGIKIARGEFVVGVDADDRIGITREDFEYIYENESVKNKDLIIADNYLSNMVACARKHNVDVVIPEYVEVNENGELLGPDRYWHYEQNIYIVHKKTNWDDQVADGDIRTVFHKIKFYGNCAFVMYARRIFAEYKLSYLDGVSMDEDSILAKQAVLAVGKFAKTSGSIYFYQRNKNGLCAQFERKLDDNILLEVENSAIKRLSLLEFAWWLGDPERFRIVRSHVATPRDLDSFLPSVALALFFSREDTDKNFAGRIPDQKKLEDIGFVGYECRLCIYKNDDIACGQCPENEKYLVNQIIASDKYLPKAWMDRIWPGTEH